MPESGQPAVSVVLPTLGSYDELRRVLDGYAAQDAPAGSFELLVVVDSADPDPDQVDAAIGTRPYPIQRLTGRIPGASSNRNAGWRAARGDLVLFTDNDTIPVPRLVSEHLRWHAANPEPHVGVLGHVRWAPELRVTPFMLWLDRGIHFDFHRIEGSDAGPGRFYTANASVKRSLLERVGGFDEERLPYLFEDIESAYRATREHGFQLLYARDAVAFTLDSAAPTLAATFTASGLHPAVASLDAVSKRHRRCASRARRSAVDLA